MGESAQHRLQYLRELIIKKLVGIVNDEKVDQSYNGPFYRAVELLGIYRATECIFTLTDRITYLPSGNEFMPIIKSEYEDYYPCASALVSIGEPSVYYMISKIGAPGNDLQRELATWVVVKIEGKENAAARFDRLIKDNKDDRWRANYQWAKDYATSYKPREGRPTLPDQKEPDVTSKGH